MKKFSILLGFIFGTFFIWSVSADESIPSAIPTSIDSLIEYVQPSGKGLLTTSDSVLQTIHKSSNSVPAKGSSVHYFEGTTSPEIPNFNPLLTYILLYDINNSRVYPKPPREIAPDEVLDYPEMSPLFMPLVFNSIRREFKVNRLIKNEPTFFLKSETFDSLRMEFRSRRFINRLAQSILLTAEHQQIGKIKYDQSVLPQPEKMIFLLDSHKPSIWIKSLSPYSNEKKDLRELPKSDFSPWFKNGFVKLQFSQTYNSPNWSKGGESNMAGLTTIFLEANYSNFNNIQFDNNIEIKIGLNTVNSDSLRNLNISTDQVKAVTKLGVRMYNDWYYSLSGEFTTQLLNNYKPNTMTFKSSFLSPAKLFVGLGVDYKKTDKKRGYNLSVMLTPLTCKMSYLYDIKNFKPKSYGIEDGKHLDYELGSKVSATITWKLSEQVQWRSRFYYFSDFTYVDSEWENNLDLNFNNYFSTSVFLHLKINDRLKREPGDKLLQMQELLSFGMVYRW